MYRGIIRDDIRRNEKMRKREEELAKSLRIKQLYEQVQTISSDKVISTSEDAKDTGCVNILTHL